MLVIQFVKIDWRKYWKQRIRFLGMCMIFLMALGVFCQH